MMTSNVRGSEKGKSIERPVGAEDNAGIYELTKEEQVFSPNELAKFIIASELRRQGLTPEAISRVLGIAHEELPAEFNS